MTDERRAFEAWAKKETVGLGIGADANGDYYAPQTVLCWEAWQARAALPGPRLEFEVDRDSETEWAVNVWLVLPGRARELLGWSPCDTQAEAEEECRRFRALLPESRAALAAERCPRCLSVIPAMRLCVEDGTDNPQPCHHPWHDRAPEAKK
jgi:hypothetical protein